jgi:hypothetical protein
MAKKPGIGNGRRSASKLMLNKLVVRPEHVVISSFAGMQTDPLSVLCNINPDEAQTFFYALMRI